MDLLEAIQAGDATRVTSLLEADPGGGRSANARRRLVCVHGDVSPTSVILRG